MRSVACAVLFICCLFIVKPVRANDALASVSPASEESALASLSDEEKVWYARFQQGYLVFDGWQKICADILQHVPEELLDSQKSKLDALGEKIGMEWSKDNSIRRIDTDMLKNWGSTMKKAVKTDPAQIGTVIAAIDQEVDSLLR